KGELFHTSGHLPYYADTMFPPVQFDEENYYLKAMNCPMHNLIFRSRGRSYRELPLRLFEFGTVYRYEKSGVVHGLTRVRGLTKDAIGRTWQMSTIQLDFNQNKRFELEYTAPDGTRQTPVMIHRALFGSIERFFGVLTEHYAGAFPAWLSPVQVVGIPITADQVEYLQDVEKALRAKGIRAEVDASDDRMQKKIRTHT